MNISEEAQQAAGIIDAQVAQAICTLLGIERGRDGEETRAEIAKVIQSAIDTATARLRERLTQGGMGIALMAHERERQVMEEKYSEEHDDAHVSMELARAATAFLLSGQNRSVEAIKEWPFSQQFRQSEGMIQDMVKSGALIAAEIDRLMRRAAKRSTLA